MHRLDDSGAMMKYIGDKMERDANAKFEGLGVTFMQLHVLFVLFEEGADMPLKKLERHFDVAQSTAAGLIVRLEKKGLIESFTPPEDRRLKMVRLTDAGRDICNRAEDFKREGNDFLLAPLNNDERQEFERLLRKICDNIQKGGKTR